jgi:formylglycine-generating enzyme required for sulfatase activity
VVFYNRVEADRPTVTLICRGNTYERKLQPPKPYQKPHAINWRWQLIQYQQMQIENAEVWFFEEELNDRIPLRMVKIPEGNFEMGTSLEEIEERLCVSMKYYCHLFRREAPQHGVRIKSFHMSMYPITQAQWREIALMDDLGDRDSTIYLNPDPSFFCGNNNRPVEQVTWNEAEEFCRRLSKLTKRKYRLPSEAEWEYACRAGSDTPFSFGDTITENSANYLGTQRQTTDVGVFRPNKFGLYDMHGNVFEWCADKWHEYYTDAPSDGSAWLVVTDEDFKHNRVMRGGSFMHPPEICRSAYRQSYHSDFRRTIEDDYGDVGFRVVCDV